MEDRFCKGAKLALWLWAGRMKEVRMFGDREDSGGEISCHRGKSIHKAGKMEIKDILFCIPFCYFSI